MDFVIIANLWQAGQANPTSKHRIAAELVRRGHRVLWVEGSGMRSPSLASGADRSRIVRKVLGALRGARRVQSQSATGGSPAAEGALWVLSPLLLPLPRYAGVRRLNGAVCAWSARLWARWLGLRDPVLINYVPVLAEAMKMWGRGPGGTGRGQTGHVAGHPDPASRHPPRVVYHCVDRWDAFRMYDAAVMTEMDARCCEYADLVIASSRDLCDRCRSRNPNTHLVLHGVDHAHFAAALAGPARPGDLPAGPIAGFFGLLSEWLDQDLVLQLAAAVPEASVVLIGAADVPIDRLRAVPNIRWLGPRPFRDLPAYVAHFGVGLIPFLVNDLTRAVNPIKLREMLSAGCPVVATALPEVEAYDGLMDPTGRSAVAIARNPAEFIDAVRERLRQPLGREERAWVSATVAGETWGAKVDEMLRLCGRSDDTGPGG